MKQHIIDTLHDLDAEINRLENARQTLHDMFGADIPPALAFPQQAPPKPTIKIPPPKAPKHIRTAHIPTGKRAPRGGSLLVERAGIVANLADPITADAVAKACKIERKAGENFITHAKAKGWLKRIGPGQYAKTSKFPGMPPQTKVAPAVVFAPAGKVVAVPDQAELQAKLKNAMAHRDRARESGAAEMVELFQKEVDELSAKLGL